ncbi:inositol 1,4,5-trisphosphate receptor-interacting protein [Megalops cyprinoides]|uniref:inositol 1,4,5-trisphosphate receptor-interacting protein n=1 Tax=Megalops cyprinoides TaxID=118141 RepID=UPI001864A701|nr:inositol 1,4,5-trisphosphate receptor-interacting protein [Megalops cyprinoides]
MQGLRILLLAVPIIYNKVYRVGDDLPSPVMVDVEQLQKESIWTEQELPQKDQELPPIEPDVSNVDHNLSQVDHDLSQVDQNLSQVDQGLSQVNQNLSPVDEGLSQVDQNLSPVDEGLSQVDQNLSPVDKRLSQVDQNQSSVGEDLSQVDQTLSTVDQELSQVDQKTQETTVADIFGWCMGIYDGLFLILFTVNLLWKKIQKSDSQDSTHGEGIFADDSVSTKSLIMDSGVLCSFYERTVRISAHEQQRVQEFVEGFADDLLEALRSVCDRDTDIEVENCIGVGSVYESWRVSRPLVCDLIVPFTPPEPYSFSCQLWCSPPNDILPDKQGWGTIKVVKAKENRTSCLCGSTNLGEDMLCLLHGKNEAPKVSGGLEDILCSEHTPYLAKDRVMKWFQIAITKAWGQISHKYEFELTFRNLDSPGALKVRFRSGRTIVFNITPAVQFENSDAYFVPQFTLIRDDSPDTYWPLSFAVYEKHLLKSLSKSLPENTCHMHCLQIVSFLHKKQTGLTGRSSLSNYHLKTALLHLLLDKEPSEWAAGHLKERLCDLLGFLGKSLREKQLYHSLIGNAQVPKGIGIPETLSAAVPLNLFQSLTSQKDLYGKTVMHFQEILRNAPVLIQEYAPVLFQGDFTQHS